MLDHVRHMDAGESIALERPRVAVEVPHMVRGGVRRDIDTDRVRFDLARPAADIEDGLHYETTIMRQAGVSPKEGPSPVESSARNSPPISLPSREPTQITSEGSSMDAWALGFGILDLRRSLDQCY